MQVRLLPQLASDAERRFSIEVDGSPRGCVVVELNPRSGTGTVSVEGDLPDGVAAIAAAQASELARRMGIAVLDGDARPGTPLSLPS
jgi:hypothetical protein